MKRTKRKNILLLSLEPSALHGEVLSSDGRIRRATIELAKTNWEQAWQSALCEFDEVLRTMMARLGVGPGYPVTIAFESPTCISEAKPIPEGDVIAGLSTLRLSMCERMAMSRYSESIQIKRVSKGTPGEGSSSGVAIATGAQESDVDCIQDWLERAGLVVRGIIPAGAVQLTEVARVCAGQGGPVARIVLHIDRYRSALGVGMKGHIDLLRTFEIGLDNLGEAIVRAAQSSPEGGSGPLSLQDALAGLHKYGLPTPGGEFLAERGLDANTVLPLVQPVMQRLSVEIKQSIKMVLRRARGASIDFEVRGPGAAISRLPDSIAQSIDAQLLVSDDALASRPIEHAAGDSQNASLRLSTKTLLARSADRRFRKAVLCGAALGCAVLAVEVGYQLKQKTDLSAKLQDMTGSLQEVRRFRETSQAVVELDHRLGDAHDILKRFVGNQPVWDASLKQLAASARSRVELTEIRGMTDPTGSSLLIYGMADAGKGANGLPSFVTNLNQSVFFHDVEVQSRILVEVEDSPVYQFRIKAALETLRPELLTMEVGQ